MNIRLERLIWRRAKRACEYCQIPQEYDEPPFQIDHILARKHGGLTTAQNLALACFLAITTKVQTSQDVIPSQDASYVFSIRAATGGVNISNGTALFLKGALQGSTPIGRSTIAVLEINLLHRVNLRQALIDENVFPPTAAKKRSPRTRRISK